MLPSIRSATAAEEARRTPEGSRRAEARRQDAPHPEGRGASLKALRRPLPW
jgi:hypothetical protein